MYTLASGYKHLFLCMYPEKKKKFWRRLASESTRQIQLQEEGALFS